MLDHRLRRWPNIRTALRPGLGGAGVGLCVAVGVSEAVALDHNAATIEGGGSTAVAIMAQIADDNVSWATQDNLTAGSRAERMAETCVASLIVSVALLGNVSLWLVILTDATLRIPANLLVLCLSGADLLVATVVMPVTASTIAHGYWTLSTGICEVWGFISMTILIASVLSLACISVSRYILILHPHRFSDIYTWKKTGGMVGGKLESGGTLSEVHCAVAVLHCTALVHCATLHCTALHCTALHYTALRYATLRYATLRYATLHCTSLHFIALHSTALRCRALPYTAN